MRVPDRFLGKVHFTPNIPDNLSGIPNLAQNLWWTWNPKARKLFRQIDLATWITTKGNAVRFLRNVPQAKLDAASSDKDILELYKEVMNTFEVYMTGKKSWWSKTHGAKNKDTLIAYFSAEYGLHEILQIYSGGLGVLSGDHCKSASDLGIPMVSIGLLYRDGYFQQSLDANGRQSAHYDRAVWEELPVNEVKDKDGKEVTIRVNFPGRVVVAKIWCIEVGRIPIFAMDTDLEENNEQDRHLTSRLYGGDQETRIQQEYLLGIGGVKALRALREIGRIHADPTLYHMNEGHAAFLSLERLREMMLGEGLGLRQAQEVIRASSLFTTHTPVPAGHDRFPLPLVEKYFRHFYESIQISRSQFFEFGLEPMPDGQQLFSMTFLALHFAGQANGVSELHGEVSRKMMAPIWQDVPPSEVPIGHVTNGVHTRTWMSFDMQNVFDEVTGPDWRDIIVDPDMWANVVESISDERLWAVKNEMKKALIRFMRDRLRQQHSRFGDLPREMESLEKIFDPNVLTIGFARRFATYKRGTLIFRDINRLSKLMNDPERPFQMVFSGKAHPADAPGQEYIRQIFEYSKVPELHNRLVYLENYDMNIGRRLTAGVDMWLNNPRRPYEASGTSGMKVPLNGGLNFSILDGWWPEAYRENPLVGWAIGFAKHYDSEEQQDAEDAEHLYLTLEREIIPAYYERNEKGIPNEWIRRVKESMKTVGPIFSTDRMVTDYTTKFYMTGTKRYQELIKDEYKEALAYAKKKEEVEKNWGNIRVEATVKSALPSGGEMYSTPVKEKIDIEAKVFLGALTPEEVIVEIYAEELNVENGNLPAISRQPLKKVKEEVVDGQLTYIYAGSLIMEESGEHGFTVRVIPSEPKLFHPMEWGLVRWASGPIPAGSDS